MTSADLSVVKPDNFGESRDVSEPSYLPACYCGRCMALTYARDAECIECGRRRPAQGWALLRDSGDRWLGRVMKGRYLITRRLGKGASATVYEAESLQISRRFAIKVVDLNTCNGDKDPELLRARLNREVEAIGRLQSPHTVPFYEVIEFSETCVGVVMKFVEGQTLDSLLSAQGSLGWRRACRLLRQLANGVHEAHDAGLIHRDLKPANIMVEPMSSGDEFAHLLDFGIVWMDDGVEVTRGFVGTPLYASPEQARGERVDRRSDIYALGAILFEMLTGRPPFQSNNVIEVLRMHARHAPPSLSEATNGACFPSELQHLVERMLAKSRQARPDDLSQVIRSLDAILAGEHPSTARPIGAVADSLAHVPKPSRVEQTAQGLGVIESVSEAYEHQLDEQAGALQARTVETLGIASASSAEVKLLAGRAVARKQPQRIFASDECDETGPKAAIFDQPSPPQKPRLRP